MALPDPAEDQLALNPYDTESSRPGIYLTAALDGRLASNGRCIVVVKGSTQVTPLWPAGTRLRHERGRTLIILPDGRGTAIYGGKPRLGGGAFGPEQAHLLPESIRRDCPAPYFVVSTAR